MISYIYYRLPILTVFAALPWQRQIFPGHSGLRALMKAMMVATIRTEKWIRTRHVTMLIKALCQTGTWKKTASDILLHSVLNQWECECYSGRPKARCYPFNLAGHRFRGKNRQVYMFHVI